MNFAVTRTMVTCGEFRIRMHGTPKCNHMVLSICSDNYSTRHVGVIVNRTLREQLGVLSSYTGRTNVRCVHSI